MEELRPISGRDFFESEEIRRLDGAEAEEGREALTVWEDEGREGIAYGSEP